jgi:hypothetical protein
MDAKHFPLAPAIVPAARAPVEARRRPVNSQSRAEAARDQPDHSDKRRQRRQLDHILHEPKSPMPHNALPRE